MKLRKLGTPLQSLRSVLASVEPQALGGFARVGHESLSGGDEDQGYSEDMLEATRTIQRFCRKQLKWFTERQRLLETDHGKATSFVVSLIRKERERESYDGDFQEASPSLKSLVRLRTQKASCLVTTGVDTFVGFRKMHCELKACELFVNQIIGHKTDSPDDLERIEEIVEEFEGIKQSFHQISKIAESKKMASMLSDVEKSQETVEQKLSEAKSKTTELSRELSTINEKCVRLLGNICT